MELLEFGRRRKAIVVPLTAVPILAGTAGAGWAMAQPAEYRHSVDVQVPAPAEQASAAMIEQSVASYRGMVESTPVIAAAARQADLPQAVVREGLGTQRPQRGGQRGTLVRVVYVGTQHTAAPQLTRAAAEAAIDELMRPAMSAARQKIARAEATADELRERLTSISKRQGGLPTEQYRSLQNQIAVLEAERDAPTGNRSSIDVAAAIKDRKRRLAALASRSIQTRSVEDQLGHAERKVSDAREELADAEARLQAAKESVTPGSPAAYPVAQAPVILRTAAMSAGAGVLLVVLVLVVTEAARRSRPGEDQERGLKDDRAGSLEGNTNVPSPATPMTGDRPPLPLAETVPQTVDPAEPPARTR